MSGEVVISLSIEETNQLRHQLGLAPLRTEQPHTSKNPGTSDDHDNDVRTTGKNSTVASSHNQEFLELSIDETNKLRQQLGLAPLKVNEKIGNHQATERHDSHGTLEEPSSNPTESNIVHAPAVHEGARQEVLERIERAKLKRQIEENIKSQFASPALGVNDDQDNHTKSWAQRMRAPTAANKASVGIAQPTHTTSTAANSRNLNTTNKHSTAASAAYQEQDLYGLHVGHSMSELADGSTTILTLKDAPLLQTAEEDTIASKKIIGLNDTTEVELQNIQLVQQQQVQDGLREKRKLELGLGRTGGYVGYDDDEFEELGGTQGPSRLARNTHTSSITGPSHATNAGTKKRKKGFQIGAMLDEQDADMETDVVTAIQRGKAISLAESITDVDVRPSDYMTPEEYIAMEEEQKRSRKSKKTKKSKDKKKQKRRTTHFDSEDEDDEAGHKERNRSISKELNTSLVDDLDATAVDGPNRKVTRKRRNRDDDDLDEDDVVSGHHDNAHEQDSMEIETTKSATPAAVTNTDSLRSKRERYEQVMAKGNSRSLKVFATTKTAVDVSNDEEPDDAFLNAALEKARRLNRLKALSACNNQNHTVSTNGAEAVVAAIQHANHVKAETTNDSNATSSDDKSKLITFQMDETHEFTRTLLARTEQMEREQARLNSKRNNIVIKLEPKVDEGMGRSHLVSTTVPDDTKSAVAVKGENVDIHELAKEVKIEDTTQQQYHVGLDGTATAVPKIGRGVGGLLQLLQQSGELQHRTNDKKKEEMRGRAKDKRTYEDYEPLDLSQVVRIDERNATEKDKEFASREVKLEYRDEHGRLLTRKEAFRDLSYQFHGYGSGKRKQEKKLQQIAREQAEARIVSQQLNEGSVHTTFGALKETQRATGKAFVVHKTGM